MWKKKKKERCIVIPHEVELAFLRQSARDWLPQLITVTAVRYRPRASRGSSTYDLIGFSWLQVKVAKGRVRRCGWFGLAAWEEKRRYRRELTAPAVGESTDEYLHDSFPTRFRASWVNECYYFLASLHSNNFGICLCLQMLFTFSTCCYHLFFNSSACKFHAYHTPTLHSVLVCTILEKLKRSFLSQTPNSLSEKMTCSTRRFSRTCCTSGSL